MVHWARPYLHDEIDEIERIASELEISQEALIDGFESNGRLIELTNRMWANLSNTDSFNIARLEDAVSLADGYDRDWTSILRAFREDDVLPAPIILSYNSDYYLVAGNTRLMISRALGLTPKAFIFKPHALVEFVARLLDE